MALIKAVAAIGVGQWEAILADTQFVAAFNPENGSGAAQSTPWKEKKKYLTQFLRDAAPLSTRLKALVARVLHDRDPDKKNK